MGNGKQEIGKEFVNRNKLERSLRSIQARATHGISAEARASCISDRSKTVYMQQGCWEHIHNMMGFGQSVVGSSQSLIFQSGCGLKNDEDERVGICCRTFASGRWGAPAPAPVNTPPAHSPHLPG